MRGPAPATESPCRRSEPFLLTFKAATLTCSPRPRRSARSLTVTGRAVNALQTRFRALSVTVGTTARRMVSLRGAVALLAGGGGLGLLIRRQAKAGATVTEMSRLLGLQTEELVALRRAGEDQGIQANQTTIAIQRLVRRYGDAIAGSKPLRQAFKNLNVELKGQDGQLRSTYDLLGDVAEGLANTEDESLKLSRAFKLFDSEGAKFAIVIDEGRDALNRNLQALIQQRAAIEQQNERLKALDQAFTDVARTLTDEVDRAIADNAEEVNLVIRAVGDLTVAFVRLGADALPGLANLVNLLRAVPVLLRDIKRGVADLVPDFFGDFLEGFGQGFSRGFENSPFGQFFRELKKRADELEPLAPLVPGAAGAGRQLTSGEGGAAKPIPPVGPILLDFTRSVRRGGNQVTRSFASMAQANEILVQRIADSLKELRDRRSRFTISSSLAVADEGGEFQNVTAGISSSRTGVDTETGRREFRALINEINLLELAFQRLTNRGPRDLTGSVTPHLCR